MDKTFLTAASVSTTRSPSPPASGALSALLADPKARRFVDEAYRHTRRSRCPATRTSSPTSGWRRRTSGAPAVDPASDPGVVTGKFGKVFVEAFITAIGMHRHWRR